MHPPLRTHLYELAACVLAIALSLAALPLHAQSFTFSTLASPNPTPFGGFGDPVEGLGDIDGDGIPDFAVGARNERRIYQFSGADGSLIRTLPPAFAIEIVNTGDVDGDGVSDLMVGSYPEASNEGRAWVYSGASGDLIHTLASPNANDPNCTNSLFGFAVGSVADVDGDDVPDLLVGAQGECPGGQSAAGRAYLFSGGDGRLLQSLEAPQPQASSLFGSALTGIADVSRDGIPDVVVGAAAEDAGGVDNAGQVYVFSGSGGTLITALQAPVQFENHSFGAALDAAGDVNQDGFPDLLVGSDGADPESWRAYIFSGFDAEVLRVLGDEVGVPSFGSEVAEIGDVTGDGVADHLIASTAFSRIFLYDGSSGDLLGEPLSVPEPSAPSLGLTISGLGDVNGDRVPDVITGSLSADASGVNRAGLAFILETVPPVLEAAPDTVDFGAVPLFATADPETVTLTNTGGVFLTVDDVRLRQNRFFPQFSLDAPATPLVLTPGASAELAVGFRPLRSTARGRVEIASSDPATPLAEVLLRGRADGAGAAQADLAEAGASVDASLAAYPNPAREAATVRFGLADAAPVRVTVYDVLGRTVAVLADAPYEAGPHTLRLDAQRLSSGVYVVRLEAGGRIETLSVAVRR